MNLYATSPGQACLWEIRCCNLLDKIRGMENSISHLLATLGKTGAFLCLCLCP